MIRFVRFALFFLGAFVLAARISFSAPKSAPALPREIHPATEEAPYPVEKFFVKRIEVVGNTLLSAGELEPLLSPVEGHTIDLQTLKDLATSITRLYARKGYLLARAYVPPQRIGNGVAQIFVIEGRIGQITVTGNSAYSSSLIKYYVAGSIHNQMINYEDFEKSLILLNEFPDLKVRAYIRPGKGQGTADVELRASDKTPIHAGIDYNNFGNRFVGRNRAGFEVWDGNLTGNGDLADVRTVFPFPSNQQPFYQVDYAVPVSSSGNKFGVSFASADIKAGQELQVLDVRGTAQIYGLSYLVPLQRTLTQSSNFNSSFYYKNVNSFVFGSILTSSDKLRELVLDYDHRLITDTSQSLFEVTGTQGLGTFLGGMGRGYALPSRAGADNTFTKFNANVTHIMKVLGSDFLVFRVEAQWALSPLAITEQYSVGGPDSVRGYQQAEILGDSGWLLSSEFRLPLNGKNASNPIQAAFFIGTGNAILNNPQPGELSVRHLTGAGVGVRANVGESTSLRADLGFPIDPGANSINENPALYTQFATQF